MESSNKRIAKNTIVVYIRLFITTVVGLITSRYALIALGVSDLGLYNVVGGIIALFAVVSGSLSSTTIRFLNIEIGKPEGDPNRIFNICNVIHIAFALLLLLLAETIGVFYINYYLNVDSGKEFDAMFVFQVSTIVSCLGLINVPFWSTLVAKEKFFLIAIVDITNALIKLAAVLSLFLFNGNTLRIYALLMSLTTLFSFIIYHLIPYKKWHELVSWNFVRKKEYYKQVLVYNNYNILATVSLIARIQGSNILINFFFGTIVNGAYAIARTLQGFVETFMANFDSAAAPRITQHVGGNNKTEAEKIVFSISRYCILMMILVFFPLYVEMEFLLSLWLGQVPKYATSFCQILLIVVLVASTSGGILHFINASGKIKWFKLQSCFWSLLVLPIGYIAFRMGFEPWWIFVFFIISDVLNRICQLYLMKRLLNFDSLNFIKQAYLKPILVIIIMSAYLSIYNIFHFQDAVVKTLGIILTTLTTSLLVWRIGLFQNERYMLLSIIRKKATRRQIATNN